MDVDPFDFENGGNGHWNSRGGSCGFECGYSLDCYIDEKTGIIKTQVIHSGSGYRGGCRTVAKGRCFSKEECLQWAISEIKKDLQERITNLTKVLERFA